jgi:phosphoribosyl-ATP pyrophosphohydrolase/phosphoribosyl-AMP cyclohydrolase/histidinol dehydrogenase
MSGRLLKRLSAGGVMRARREPVDEATLGEAARIVRDVRERGWDALREHALRLGDVRAEQPLVIEADGLRGALAGLEAGARGVLERAAERIGAFAAAQRESLRGVARAMPGGEAGHWIAPVERAGCYAPGGRFALPSSVLMTAVTARAAGVEEVWVASPRPTQVTLAAAGLAGAAGVLAVGGAQAIAALAFGAGAVPACDCVVGPGNKWVTAAKSLVSGRVGIDMLAGPSEVVVLADSSAPPGLVAADLLAQAEHDPDASAILVTIDEGLAGAVEAALGEQLRGLSTAATARASLERNGAAVVCAGLEEAVAVCDALAPEHLEVMTREAEAVAKRLKHFGGIFIGPGSAEVLGDYGAGPNHVLPTGGVARFAGGLSVLTFLRVRTYIRVDDGSAAAGLYADAARLARLEGLEAHARAAERRLGL